MKTAGGLLIAVVLGAGIYLGGLQVTGNFHPVIAGELYRSAQPTAADIVRHHADEGIRTIINLRGENQGAPWYDDEVAQSKQLGITHIDFAMRASRELTKPEAAALIDLLKHAEKPVLIHCQAGADRSGLAAALYVAAATKLGEEAAEDQLSLQYGHIPVPVSSAYAMDRTFEALEPWLGFPDS